MEAVLASVIGVLGGAGVWLVLRPRTFQVIMGFTLLSYAVNLFIFSVGSIFPDKPPLLRDGVPMDLEHYTDPRPQSLVLTAIVIAMATTTILLMLASLGRNDDTAEQPTGTDAGYSKMRLSPSALSTAGRNARLNPKKLEEIRAREISHVDNESLKVTD